MNVVITMGRGIGNCRIFLDDVEVTESVTGVTVEADVKFTMPHVTLKLLPKTVTIDGQANVDMEGE